jgi:hypothetical protein
MHFCQANFLLLAAFADSMIVRKKILGAKNENHE